jgi:hypothetical protein
LPHRGVIFAALLLLLSLALAGGGCKGKSGKDGATATATAQATAPATSTRAPAGTATPAPAIRLEDFSKLPGLQQFLASSGGKVATDLITYVDLTEDGVDDAVVPISSGGEGGDIAVFVFGYGAGGLKELLRVIPESGLKDNVVDGKLAITEPVFAPGDPRCCPSQLRTITYRWDGTQLIVADERTEPVVQN